MVVILSPGVVCQPDTDPGLLVATYRLTEADWGNPNVVQKVNEVTLSALGRQLLSEPHLNLNQDEIADLTAPLERPDELDLGDNMPQIGISVMPTTVAEVIPPGPENAVGFAWVGEQRHARLGVCQIVLPLVESDILGNPHPDAVTRLLHRCLHMGLKGPWSAPDTQAVQAPAETSNLLEELGYTPHDQHDVTFPDLRGFNVALKTHVQTVR